MVDRTYRTPEDPADDIITVDVPVGMTEQWEINQENARGHVVANTVFGAVIIAALAGVASLIVASGQ